MGDASNFQCHVSYRETVCVCVVMLTGSSGSVYELLVGFCRKGNEPRGLTNSKEVLGHVSEW
jgi:hypothetical protein